MSLHKFAEQVASQGRGDDSLLVHMTPDEVQRLQSFAQANGRSLTINPTTGLPEAGLLSDLFKAVAPIALGAFLGPAGVAFGGPGLSAAMAGVATGGITALATGSLSRGLMAGMGAYGGAGLAEGFANAGANAMTTAGVGDFASSLAERGIYPTLESGAVNPAFGEGASKIALEAQKQAFAAPITERLSAGLGAFTASPESAMDFAKANWKPIAAAALPVLSAIGTTTPGPTASPMAPGRIREKRWDGRQFVDVASTDAGVYNTSGRNFSDLYRGYNGGGIVALAGGGMPHYDGSAGSVVGAPKIFTDEQLYQQTGDWNKAAALRDAQNAAQAKYNAADYVTKAAIPTATTADFIGGANTADIGLNQPLATALQNSGLSTAAQYALTHADIGPNVNTEETYGGLKGLSSNINYLSSGLQKQIAAGTLTGQKAQANAIAEMNKYGINDADIFRATGKTLKELFPDTVVKKVGDTGTGITTNIPSGYHLEDGVLVPNINATQNTTTDVVKPTDLFTAPATSLPVGVSGNTGPSQIGGGATVNANGTITTSPRIPDISVGGFTGSKNLRDTYTKGGGSLGFAPKAPETMDEFNTMFNKQTGDSLAAYNYLTGKAGAAYPIKSGVGQIARPYDEAVLGYPARGNLPYIYNKVTGKMDVNPDYVAPGRDDKGNVTYSMSTNDIKSALKDTPMSGQTLYDWAMSNNLSAQQISDATGQPLSQVYAQFRAGQKAKATADKKKTDDDAAAAAANSQVDSSSTGGQAAGGLQQAYAMGGYALGGLGSLGSYSDGGRLLRGPGDGVSDSIPATIGNKQQPARLADGEFVVPARIVSELGNGSTDAGAKKLYAMLDRVQRARGKTTGRNKVAANSRAEKYLPA